MHLLQISRNYQFPLHLTRIYSFKSRISLLDTQALSLFTRVMTTADFGSVVVEKIKQKLALPVQQNIWILTGVKNQALVCFLPVRHATLNILFKFHR